MTYHIDGIELFVRETKPGRMLFTLGKHGQKPKSRKGLTSPLGHVRLTLRDDTGRRTWGTAADRLSVRWLDKRPGRSQDLKRRELVDLITHARKVYLDHADFERPFTLWRSCFETITAFGRSLGQEDLTCCFASALMERAVLSAVARLHGKPLFAMVREDRLGFAPGEIHKELRSLRPADYLPKAPRTRFRIRHTVGLADPLTARDLPKEERVDDGLPETLEEYIREDGVSAFKIKISGHAERDIDRLGRLWEVIPHDPDTIVSLDANEAFTDLEPLARFVEAFRERLPDLFALVRYIEQPLERTLTLDPSTRRWIRKIGRVKPLIIDEADGTLEAFPKAHDIGYAGTSCKNCKGVFHSLLNRALVTHYNARDERTFITAEDLQNLPIVPLHQDFVALSVLDVKHCERNGHHYNYGLSMLTEKEKASVARHHRDLYVRRGDEWFLNIRDGAVECASLQAPGFGVIDEPDWPSMTDMRTWVDMRHPKIG